MKEIKKYTFKEGLPQEFEILNLTDLYDNFYSDITSPHRTGFYHIVWFQKGTPQHMVDFNRVDLEQNSMLFLNKNTVHNFDEGSSFDGKVILFTEEFFNKTIRDRHYLKSNILFNDLLSVSRFQLGEKESVFRNLITEMELELSQPKDHAQAEILHNLLHNFMMYAERERRLQNFTEIMPSPYLETVIQFKDILENQVPMYKPAVFFTNLMGISAKRLNRATNEVFGKSSKQMIDDRVMLEAKRLLAHTQLSVKEICFELGFEESTNFIKYFKKHQNATPLEFKEGLFHHKTA